MIKIHCSVLFIVYQDVFVKDQISKIKHLIFSNFTDIKITNNKIGFHKIILEIIYETLGIKYMSANLKYHKNAVDIFNQILSKNLNETFYYPFAPNP